MTLEKLTANEKNANGMFLMTKSIIINCIMDSTFEILPPSQLAVYNIYVYINSVR